MEQKPNSSPDLETVARLRECLLNVRSRVDPLLQGKERTSRAELSEILPLAEVCCCCFGGVMVCWGEEAAFNSHILDDDTTHTIERCSDRMLDVCSVVLK